jgi:hypothetical protein
VSLLDLAPTLLIEAGIEDAEPRSVLTGTGTREPLAETLYGYRLMGWAQLFSARSGTSKLIRGRDEIYYDLSQDPGERIGLVLVDGKEAGNGASHENLDALINRYRTLEPGIQDAGEVSPEVRALPYASGLGRARLQILDWETNRKLRTPDPAFAARLDQAKGKIGTAIPESLDAEFESLAEEDPENPSIPFWRGRNQMLAGNSEGAARLFQLAFDKGLAEARILSLLIQQLLLSEQVEEAAKVVETKLSEVVPDTGLWLMVGMVHVARDEGEKARLCADRAEASARSQREHELVSRFRHNLRAEKEQ